MPTHYYASQPFSTVVDDKIIFIGEYEEPERVNLLYSYDSGTDNWTKITSCPFTHINGIASTTGVKAPKLVYVLGVYYPEGRPETVTQAYDLEKDTWTKVSPMPSGRGSFEIAVANDIIYTIGGGGPTNINDQYTPIGYSTAPTISFIETQTKTYNQSSFSLNLTLDKPINWTGYSLDNQENVTFTGNLYLTNLLNGDHNLTVYANDTYGSMGASEMMYFTVDVPVPFPIELVLIAAIAIFVTLGAIVLYYKRKKLLRWRLPASPT